MAVDDSLAFVAPVQWDPDLVQHVVNEVAAIKAAASVTPPAQAPVSYSAPAASWDLLPHEATARGPTPLHTFPPIPQPRSTQPQYPPGAPNPMKIAYYKVKAA